MSKTSGNKSDVVPDSDMRTVVDLLRWRAATQPDYALYTYLRDGETREVQLTLGQLDRTARAIASVLRESTRQGDRALLMYPPGLEFVAAFFGCLYAGVLAVPVSPPRRNRPDQRLSNITRHARPAVVLTTSELLNDNKAYSTHANQLAGIRWLATDNVPSDRADSWHETRLSGDDLAFLQYTSGSTGKPKGVMVSHENLMQNQHMIKQAFGHDDKTIVAGWLPLFHDMGLVGNLLQPLYIGRPVVLMAPTAFLQQPIRWLRMISRYGATTSGGPNFAYELCVQNTTPQQRIGLDLSTWDIAFNGAEPIRASTLREFVRNFASHGFRAQALYPCYGMAEATLFIAGAEKTSPPIIQTVSPSHLEENRVRPASPTINDNRSVVSCGPIRPGIDVRIVNPDTSVVSSAGEVGEIWVAGRSVARGYWQQPEATEQTFQAYTSDTGEGPFLRTGDLGFLHENQLYITGRLKDLVIVRGSNHYPQDIELTVHDSHAALRSGGGAAFVAEIDGIEQLVVAQEVERTHLRGLHVNKVVQAVRTAVTREHQLQVNVILLLRPMSIPKTTSGKIQRHLCRKKMLSNELDVIDRWECRPFSRVTRTTCTMARASQGHQTFF